MSARAKSNDAVWRAEAETALKQSLEYLRGDAPGVTSGSHRNGDLRARIKWVLLGCGGPLRSDAVLEWPIDAPQSRDPDDCPGHVASEVNSKICGRCGIHIDELRPPDAEDAT